MRHVLRGLWYGLPILATDSSPSSVPNMPNIPLFSDYPSLALLFAASIVTHTWLFRTFFAMYKREPLKDDRLQLSVSMLGAGISILCFIWIFIHQPLQPQPFPESGNFTRYGAYGTTLQEDSVRIKLDGTGIADNDDPNHFASFRDWDTDVVVLEAYVTRGNSALVALPPGTYKFLLTKGTTWYGAKRMFGYAMPDESKATPVKFSQGEHRIVRLDRSFLPDNLEAEK